MSHTLYSTLSEAINQERYLNTVLDLEKFEGRLPGSNGEEMTIQYLTKTFECISTDMEILIQDIDLVRFEPLTLDDAVFEIGGQRVVLDNQNDITVKSWKSDSLVQVQDSDVVFVGFGIDAPEYQWNDFESVDVAGKTIICLVNDPGYYGGNESFFEGDIMTYYGRWTYKYEEAVRQGAEAVFIVHDDGPAGYPWSVPANGKQIFSQLPRSDYPLSVQGWITSDAVSRLFNLAGLDWEATKAKASVRGFTPISLGMTCTCSLEQSISEFSSRNFMARLPGIDRDSTILYSAHYDHFGIKGGEVYAGSRDNGIGVAALVELAHAFSKIPAESRQKSIVFYSSTCEEAGLLGAEYYCENPEFFPLEKMSACINFDIINIFGPTKDIAFYGWGKGGLEAQATLAAEAQGRVIRPDPTPTNGMFYRSDHIMFSRKGVPVLFPIQGFEHQEIEDKDYILNLHKQWTAQCYHQPSDIVITDKNDPWFWDMRGAVQDVQLTLHVGLQLLN